MQTRQLGSTDLYISPIGLGTVKLGRDQGVKYPQGFTIPNDASALKLLATAQDLGINLIDTAPAYGRSETRLGGLLKGQRNEWIICSKVGEEFEQGKSWFDFSPEHTIVSIERSLQRLASDYIDIVLVHSDGNDLNIIDNCGTLEALEQCKQRGLIRAFGMSTKTVEGGLKAAQLCDAVMLTYNLQERADREVLDYCAANNKGAIIKKALASGHVCLDGEDPVQKSFDMIFAHPAISSVIVGTINPLHLCDNVAAVQRAIG